MADINEVCDYLLHNDNYLILMHASPDGDTVGSGYALCRALRSIGKTADCACADPIPARYGYMLDGVEPTGKAPQHIVAVDVADTKLLGELREKYEGKIELCIDHHGSNLMYAGMTLLRPSASAACEIIFDVVLGLGCELDANIAACLYTGIATDTGCFKFSNATAHTHRVAAQLMERGIDSSEINRIMFDTKSRGRLAVERMALENIEFHFGEKCAMVVMTQQMQSLASPDELEGINALTRQIEGVVVGVTLKEKGPQLYKISVRSHPPVDASAVCGHLGGGGHPRAAGCEVALPLEQAKQAVLDAISKESTL